MVDLPSDFFSAEKIDLMALCHNYPELAHSLVANPLSHEYILKSKPLCNIPDCFFKEALGCHDYNHLVKIKGTIIRVGPIVYKNISSHFICVVCKAENSKSLRCFECGGNRLTKKMQTKDVICSQTIKIQDISRGISTIEAVFEDKRLGRIIPGDQVIVTGIVALQMFNTYLKENDQLRYGYVVRGLSIEVLKNNIVHDDLVFEKFLRSDNKRRYVIDIFCSKIYGLSHIKLGLILSIVGNVESSSRSNAHCLLVGDSAMGKTVLLQYIQQIVTPSRYINSLTTSEVGLTACAIRQDKDWALEAGALVVTHGGVCCLDNFDSLGNSQKSGLLEAMEQQTISIAKAGICVRLNASTSVIAASGYMKVKKHSKKLVQIKKGEKTIFNKPQIEHLNSHKKHHSRKESNSLEKDSAVKTHHGSESMNIIEKKNFYRSSQKNIVSSNIEQLNDLGFHETGFDLKKSVNITTPLLSRFDLIFGIFQDHDFQKLSNIADAMLYMPETCDSDYELRCIIEKIKTFEVKDTNQFKGYFLSYYRLLTHNKLFGEINTIRVVESLQRLSINSAKLFFRNEVILEDVATAIFLFETSLRGINIIKFDSEKIFRDEDYFHSKQEKLFEILGKV